MAPPTGTTAPDQFLFDRAAASMKDKKYLTAREYYTQIFDNYPQSPLRPEAKLGIGETYLEEGGEANLVLAENEFKEFITFYPTNSHADQAQYKLAMTHFSRMKAPQRDQTETLAAVREFEVFFDRYPNSTLTPEVRAKWRMARSRLSEASYRVGLYYFRVRWYPGAIDRFKDVLKSDPQFSNRDALYYYLAESLYRSSAEKKAEALPYFERLVKEFEKSEFLTLAQKRIAELKTAS